MKYDIPLRYASVCMLSFLPLPENKRNGALGDEPTAARARRKSARNDTRSEPLAATCSSCSSAALTAASHDESAGRTSSGGQRRRNSRIRLGFDLCRDEWNLCGGRLDTWPKYVDGRPSVVPPPHARRFSAITFFHVTSINITFVLLLSQSISISSLSNPRTDLSRVSNAKVMPFA